MSIIEHLQEQRRQEEVDRRLVMALAAAGRSALGMPSAVDTFKAWLSEAGLALVPESKERANG